MTVDGQQLAALALTTGAACYIGRAVWKVLRSARGDSACGSCGSCRGDEADGANRPTLRPLVQLDLGSKPSDDDDR